MNDVVLRSQAQAIYDARNIGHFGLNLDRYAHFTSPIRRYADLIVHRALIRGLALGGGGGLSDREIGELPQIAETISMTERRAMAAERDSTDRYVAAYMQAHLGMIFEARIAGVIKFGLFVRLKDSGAEGLLPARRAGAAKYFRYDERRQAMIGERSGVAYVLGDTVRVKLMEAAPITGGLRFELAEGGEPARASRPPRPGKLAQKNRFQAEKNDNFQMLACSRLTGAGGCFITPLPLLLFGVRHGQTDHRQDSPQQRKRQRFFLCHQEEHPDHDREILDQEIRSGAAQACVIQGRQRDGKIAKYKAFASLSWHKPYRFAA